MNFDSDNPRPVWLDWFWVALCAGVIYATLPYGPIISDRLGRLIGYDNIAPFGNGLLTGLIIAVIWRISILKVHGSPLWVRALWMVPVIAGYIYTLSLMNPHTPAERLHFVEYGILTLLLFRAMKHHSRSKLIYPQVVCMGYLIGLGDESVQELIPIRVGDIQDTIWNLTSVCLMTGAVFFSWRPRWIVLPPSRADWTRSGILIALVALMPALFIQNIHVFGHAHTDERLNARFKSLLDASALTEADRSKTAVETASVLNATDDAAYDDFLKAHPQESEAFLHEMRVHLFRRDRYQNQYAHYSMMNTLIALHKSGGIDTAPAEIETRGRAALELPDVRPFWDDEGWATRLREYAVKYQESWLEEQGRPKIWSDELGHRYMGLLVEKAQEGRSPKSEADLIDYLHIAINENKIIETYFGRSLAFTTRSWPDALKVESAAKLGDRAGEPYISPVSDDLIAAFNPIQMWIFSSLTAATALLLSSRFKHRATY